MAISRTKFYGGGTNKPARRTRFRQKVTVVSSEVILEQDISRNLDRIDHVLSAREKEGENEFVKEDIYHFLKEYSKH